MHNVAKFLKKEPVDVVESAGGITMRVMIPLINESIRIWIEGIASAAEIDRVINCR